MKKRIIIKGIKGNDFEIDPNDKLSVKLAMLYEGHCTIGVYEAIEKYGKINYEESCIIDNCSFLILSLYNTKRRDSYVDFFLSLLVYH